MNIQKSNITAQNLAFKGHSKKLDKQGYPVHKFFYLYDADKYNCEVELYNISKNKKGDLGLKGEKPVLTFPLGKDGNVTVDIDSQTAITSDIGFAYRFKLTDKNDKKAQPTYAFDNGTVIGIFSDKEDDKYNVVLNNRATINKNGAMQLIMPDEYYPGVENVDGKPSINEGLRAKALTSVRNHANKLGGNFFGIIQRLPELEKEGVKRIVGTPFTKDTISSHLYWTENAYRVAPNLGTEEEFKILQEELFKHGINWISDAALVNEGFGGIHLSEFLRRGPESISKDMFRAGEKVSLGILPDKCDYTRMKIINAPFSIDSDGTYSPKNPNYDSKKPTYVQFYDDRLASPEQKASDKPMDMTTYANKNTDNIYDITRHDDAVYPFPVEVNPAELSRNINRLAKRNGGTVDLSKIDNIKAATDFTYFNVVNKSAAGGLEVWDGNVDIAKLNFYRADKDDERFSNLPDYQKEQAIENFDRGALAVRDYAINSGKYWTKLATDTQLSYASKLFGPDANLSNANSAMSHIRKLVSDGSLPASTLDVVDVEVVKNVLDGNYHSRLLDDADMRSDINPQSYFGNDYSTEDYILKQAMDVPLETLPVATNLLGILTSPYIAKKASVSEELGVSRFDLYSAENPNLPEKYSNVYSQMDDVYKEDVAELIGEIMGSVPGLSEDDNVSAFGKYVITEAAPDLTKYLLLRALAPTAQVTVSDDGKFDFSKVDESAITLQSLGIPFEGKTSEQEAQIVVNKIKDGLAEIPQDEIDELKAKIANRFSDRTENSFKLAEMIHDRTESGLGWRIDAAKDIASIDSVRADVDSMTDAWNNVIDFWKSYNQAVLAQNPHAYTTAEITDLYDLFKDEDKTIFTSDADAERKFLEETGITAVANYNYFFSLLPNMFVHNSIENGGTDDNWMAQKSENHSLREKLDQGWSGTNPGFLFQSPADGVTNSYTFVGNHDKPRLLHGLSLDMGLFHSDFSKAEHRAEAEKVLMKQIKDFDNVNSKAVAMGSRLNDAFAAVVTDKSELNAIKVAISELASGTHKGKKFDATAFGTRPLEIAVRTVLDQVEYNGESVKTPNVESKVLANILEPAFDRFYSIYKLLITLPGSPTDFAGDRVASTGYETKAKNYHQQNRNIINWEWLEKPEYKFVRQFYDKMNDIASLRTKPELSALNDGATVTLPIITVARDNDGKIKLDKEGKVEAEWKDCTVQGMLRYNDAGSVVLTLHNLSGSKSKLDKKMDRTTQSLATEEKNIRGQEEKSIYDKVILAPMGVNAKQGLKHGLEIGTTFKNQRAGDNTIYRICSMTVDKKDYYCLRRYGKDGELPITITPDDLNTLILYKV
ncbi:hypothetical protein IJD15_06215 [bacterium]|nr:hypothetical protein [bacterium]